MRAAVSKYAAKRRKINRMTVAVAALAGILAIRMAGAEAVPPRILAKAKRVVERVFGRSGVAVTWTAGRETAVLLEIVDRRVSNGAAGFAVVGGHGVVSYPQAVAAAGECGQEAHVALGAAMAHEAGHVLLGGAHSRLGVMKARLGCEELRRAARGELGFEKAEAQRLRVEVRRR